MAKSSRREIATLLGIPAHLIRDPDAPVEHDGVRISYLKYQTILRAFSTLTRMLQDGDWLGRKPAGQDIIDMVVSKSMWYSHYKKLLPQVPDYPDMQKWLQNDQDSPPDSEIWTHNKTVYAFHDLADWYKERAKQTKGQKGKQGKQGKQGKKNNTNNEEDTVKKSKKKKKN